MSSRAGGIEHLPEDPGSLTGSPAYHRRGQVLRRRGLRHAHEREPLPVHDQRRRGRDAAAGQAADAQAQLVRHLDVPSFAKPGRYLIVARAGRGGFFTGWSAPTVVNAIAPFDLASVKFPDDKGPSYKLKGQIREHSARGKVTIYLAKGKKRGRFHKVGKAKISKKGRFTKRLTIRHTGTYRLRYIYRGNSTVAAGRVTERIQITRHLFF